MPVNMSSKQDLKSQVSRSCGVVLDGRTSNLGKITPIVSPVRSLNGFNCHTKPPI